jgi:putative phosphoribosyl transferase
MVLNNEMITALGLTSDEIKNQKAKTLKKIREREKKYRKERKLQNVAGKIVIVVDDGLASGYTMIVACRTLRKQKPKKIIVAVPCASKEAYERVIPEADEIISLNIKTEYPFAVADFYKNWYDVADKEVLVYLNMFKSKC